MLTDPATTTESPYQNQSSSSYATPTPIATIKPTEASGWYYRLWMMYAMPVVIVLGLLNNVISLFVFSSSRLQLAPRLKLYYEAIAICDMFTIVTYELLTSYLGDGLAFTTDGAFSLRLFNWSDWVCKTTTTIWTLSLQTSCYTLASLCVERALALCSPLRSRAFLTNRWIVGQWLVINGVPNVSMIIMTYLGQNVVPIHSELSALHVHHGLGIGGENSEDEDGARMSGVALEHVNVKRDCQPDWRTWIYPLYSWLGCGFLFFFHALIMLVCSALISYKLLVTSQRKQSMLATVFVGRGSAYAAQQQRKQSSSSGRSGNGASDRRGKGQSDRRSVQIGEPGNGFQGQSDESKERERRGSPFASAASLRFTALMQEERELNEQMLSSSCKLIRDRSSSSTFDQCSTRNISGIESTKYESINEPKSKRMSLQNGESHRYLTVRQSYLTKSTSVTQSITAMTRSSPTRESPPQVAHVPVAWNRSPHVSTGAFGDSARDASREALARKGNARELRSAITVCTLAIFQAACYVPSAIICMAFCIASEYPNWIKANPTTYRHIYEAHLMAKALTALSHVTNIYSYIACLPAFRRALLVALGFEKQNNSSGDVANSYHSVALHNIRTASHSSPIARRGERNSIQYKRSEQF